MSTYDKEVVSFRMDAETHVHLRDVANRLGCTISDLLRLGAARLIEQFRNPTTTYNWATAPTMGEFFDRIKPGETVTIGGWEATRLPDTPHPPDVEPADGPTAAGEATETRGTAEDGSAGREDDVADLIGSLRERATIVQGDRPDPAWFATAYNLAIEAKEAATELENLRRMVERITETNHGLAGAIATIEIERDGLRRKVDAVRAMCAELLPGTDPTEYHGALARAVIKTLDGES